MNPDRLMLKGRLSELENLRRELTLKIDANVKAAKTLLAASSVTPVEKLDLDGALINLNEACELKRELGGVKADIAKIEDELE